MLALPVIAVVTAVVTCIGAQLVIVLARSAALGIAVLAHLDRSRIALLCWLATAAVLPFGCGLSVALLCRDCR
jgi:hypothetical protein